MLHTPDMRPASDIFYYYAGWARNLHGEVIPVDGPFLNYTLREPVGVVGMITAWNYPMLLAAWKVAPALATGCACVIKPSELTPLTTLRLAELCQEAGAPDERHSSSLCGLADVRWARRSKRRRDWRAERG